MIAIVHCEERTSIQRRAFVIGGFAAAVGCSVPPVAHAATALALPTASANRRFSVLYKGYRIGTHAVSYSSATGEMLVKTEIHLEAKLAFFPAYAFSHRSEEAWRAGQLMSLSSETVERGERLRVEGVATPQGFRVLSTSGPFIASAATLTFERPLDPGDAGAGQGGRRAAGWYHWRQRTQGCRRATRNRWTLSSGHALQIHHALLRWQYLVRPGQPLGAWRVRA